MPYLARFVIIVVVAGAALALGVGVLTPEVKAFAGAGRAGPGDDLVSLAELSQRSLVYARDGSLLAALHAEENRSPVKLDGVPHHVVNAILDVEDDQFWSHGGVNLRSTLRALVTNVQSGEVRQGGSTITQQLVKNALLTPEKSMDRKIREAVLAVRLEDQLSKHEILERYLNTVYFGNGAYGVQAAAETYFGVDVGRLTAGQAALLAGIIRNPVGYDPIRFPKLATARRDLALDRMVANGHLTAAEAARFAGEPLPSKVVTPLPPPNDYFVEEVKQRLLADRRLGETPQERYNAVFKGGLKIHTTLDPRMQGAAEQSVRQNLPNSKGRFAAALASVEPATGAVRAIVAGDDFNSQKYNLATQGKRQPGSSFKVIVLLAALEAGHGPNDIIDGTSPCTIKLPGNEPYTPGNYEGSSGGVMTLTDATARSLNCAYARLGAVVGLDKVVDMAARLGIPRDRLKPYLSISLGAQEATPLEMSAAFAAIANDGTFLAPRFVERVEDRHGRVVFEGPDKGRRVFSPQVARMAIQVLEKVVTSGTGTRARLPGREVAGKTGTSQNHENAWFVGFTPQLSTAVWMGAPEGNVAMIGVGRSCGRVTGGCYPAMIWRGYMQDALSGLPSVRFADPNAKQIPRAKEIRDRTQTPPRRSPSRPRRTVPPVEDAVVPLEPPPETTPPPTARRTPPTSEPPATTTTQRPTTTARPTTTTKPPTNTTEAP